ARVTGFRPWNKENLGIGFADLPVPRRVVKALLETFQSLFLTDMKKELDDGRIVLLPQKLLKIVNQFVPFRPDLPGNQLMDTSNKHVIIVRTIKDGDSALCRHVGVNTPEKIVVKLGGRRNLEWRDGRTLRVHGPHHVADSAIFTSRVQSLQHDQQR